MADFTNQKVWNGQKQAIKKGDNILKDGRSSDIVIPVLGSSGVGKSTFVNALIGANKMKIGHDLKACTTKIQHAILPNPRNPDQRLVIVDTPSFDIIDVDDVEILRQFSVWLATSYTSRAKIGGVIYLHDISAGSMDATTLKNLEIFQKVYGPDGFHSFVLATTKWDSVKEAVGQKREQQLVSDYWKKMIESGSPSCRFTNTAKSAWDIVNIMLDVVESTERDAVGALLLQKELVDFQKKIPDTEAGRVLRYTLQQLEEIQRGERGSTRVLEHLKDLKASIPKRFMSLFDAIHH